MAKFAVGGFTYASQYNLREYCFGVPLTGHGHGGSTNQGWVELKNAVEIRKRKEPWNENSFLKSDEFQKAGKRILETRVAGGWRGFLGSMRSSYTSTAGAS